MANQACRSGNRSPLTLPVTFSIFVLYSSINHYVTLTSMSIFGRVVLQQQHQFQKQNLQILSGEKKKIQKYITKKWVVVHVHKLNKLFLQFSSFFAINNYFSEIQRGKIGRKKNEEKSGSNYYYPTLEQKVLPILDFFFSIRFNLCRC